MAPVVWECNKMRKIYTNTSKLIVKIFIKYVNHSGESLKYYIIKLFINIIFTSHKVCQ